MDSVVQTSMAATRPLHMVIAAGPRLLLDALQALLDSSGQARVVDASRDFPRLRLVVMQRRPDAVLVRLPLEGLQTPEQLLCLRRALPDLAIAVLAGSRNMDPGFLCGLARTAPVALLHAEARTEDLMAALCAMRAGLIVVDPRFASEVVREATKPAAPRKAYWGVINKRQCLILQGLADGLHEAAIAEKLNTSVRTVQADIARIRAGLDAADRTHAVALALEAGMIAGPSLSKEDRW